MVSRSLLRVSDKRANSRTVELRGLIASAGFASGDRIVIGHWLTTPIGPFTDVMWARPDGERRLLAPSFEALELITGIYHFDREEVVDVRSQWIPASRLGRAALSVDSGPLAIRVDAGRAVPIPGSRSLWFTRWVQGPVAKLFFGVRTYGVTATSVQEWYRARSYRRVLTATAAVDGVDLGAMRPVRPRTGFGFSEPPPRPSLVEISPLLRWTGPALWT